MAEEIAASEAETPRVRLRRNWARRLIDELLALFVALLLLLAVGLVMLDTAPGHRFIVDRIAGFETASGLTVLIWRASVHSICSSANGLPGRLGAQ